MNDKNIKPLKELASGAIISLVFGLAGYVFMFLFKIFVARIFGPEDLGLFEMANTLLSIGGLISLIGIHTGVSRYIAVYEERKEFKKLKGYLKFIFQLPLLISLFISIAIFFAAPLISGFFNFGKEFISIVRIISLAVPFRVINEIAYQIFFAKKKVFFQNLVSNIIEKGILVLGIFLTYFFDLSIIYAIWLLVLSVFVSSISSLLYLKLRIYFEKGAQTLNNYKDWLYFSIPMFIVSISSFFINWTDNIVIGKVLTSYDLGIYATSFSLASFLLFFQSSFIGIFIPTMSRLYAGDKKEEFLEMYKKAQNWVFALSLPFGLFFIFFAKDLIRALFGPSYLGGSLPLIILSAGLLINVYTGINAPLMRVVKKTVFLFKTKLIFAVFNIILSVVMAKKMGISGVAIATAISISGEQLVCFLKTRSYFKVRHNNINNFKIFILGIVLVLIISSVFKISHHYNHIATLILAGILYLVCFFIALVLSKVFDKNDLIIVKSLANGKQK